MIIEYETRIELLPIDPMYGKSKLIGKYNNLKDAVSAAKQTCCERAYVIEVQYTNLENYKRSFSLQAYMRWNPYIQESEEAAKEASNK